MEGFHSFQSENFLQLEIMNHNNVRQGFLTYNAQ